MSNSPALDKIMQLAAVNQALADQRATTLPKLVTPHPEHMQQTHKDTVILKSTLCLTNTTNEKPHQWHRIPPPCPLPLYCLLALCDGHAV